LAFPLGFAAYRSLGSLSSRQLVNRPYDGFYWDCPKLWPPFIRCPMAMWKRLPDGSNFFIWEWHSCFILL
jgi:hypothetical protein